MFRFIWLLCTYLLHSGSFMLCLLCTETEILERVIHDSFAEKGRKLFVTMNIRNVTFDHDSLNGKYECHAYAVKGKERKTYTFSINVIKSKTL